MVGPIEADISRVQFHRFVALLKPRGALSLHNHHQFGIGLAGMVGAALHRKRLALRAEGAHPAQCVHGDAAIEAFDRRR